jgi:methionyl-tRNA formyltransferase
MRSKLMLLVSKQLGLSCLDMVVSKLGPQHIHVVTPDDTGDSRSLLPHFQKLAASTRFPFDVLRQPSDLHGLVAQSKPDAVLVANWYWLIAPETLAVAPRGFAGLHGALLPQLRGNAPLVWAILLGLKQTGITLFYLDPGMDTGDIIDQRIFPIGRNDSIAELLLRAECAGLEMLGLHLEGILDGTAPRRAQDSTQASYASARRPEDGFINWNWPAEKVFDFIRAQTRPYPGAFTSLPDGKRVTIWRGAPFSHTFYGIPGLVCQKFNVGVIVACGAGAIVVEECQLANDPVSTGADLLRWGTRLGGNGNVRF